MRVTWLASRAAMATLAFTGVTFAAVLFFDFQTTVPFFDEVGFRWAAAHWATTGQLRLFPIESALGLPQLVVSAGMARLGIPPVSYRLIELVGLGLVMWWVTRLALRLGAAPVWAAVAGAAVATAPVMLVIATGLETDPLYCGLLAGAAAGGVEWLESGRAAGRTTVLAALATLQRQTGVVAAPAITIGLLLASRGGQQRWRRPWLLALWASQLAIFLVPATGLGVPAMNPVTGLKLTQAMANAAGTLAVTGVVVGMLGLPLLPALVARPLALRGVRGWSALVPSAVAMGGLAAAVYWVARNVDVMPGEWLNQTGLGKVATMPGTKPILFPPGLYIPMELLFAGSGAALLWLRRDLWVPARLTPVAAFLGLLALGQFALMVLHSPTDRYYLPVAVIALPWVAAQLPAPRSLVRPALALTALIAGLGVYVAGEQDYQAWQVAKDVAAREAYRTTPPEQVYAGFDADTLYVIVPYLSRHGEMPAGNSFHATVAVVLAGPDDPRPGIAYHSLAPGKVVIIRARQDYP